MGLSFQDAREEAMSRLEERRPDTANSSLESGDNIESVSHGGRSSEARRECGEGLRKNNSVSVCFKFYNTFTH